MSSKYTFTVMFQPAEEGGYNVFVPALPGCMTQGETLEQAKCMAEDAIQAYCESLIKDGEPVPRLTKGRILYPPPARQPHHPAA